MTVQTFAEAIDASAGTRTSVLLGNGFSIDYSPVFRYSSLVGEARFPGLSVEPTALFRDAGSDDFETVVERLDSAARLLPLYGAEGSIVQTLRADAAIVRTALATTLADLHPASAAGVAGASVLQARTFLQHFGDIFTLNYDLILYWALNRQHVKPAVVREDGFRSEGSDLVWAAGHEQHVHYLHGAFHLYADGSRTVKLRYADHGMLVAELHERLAQGRFPLLVTEGTREAKERRITESPYLAAAAAHLADLDGTLFVHGVSLAPNDGHIVAVITAAESHLDTVVVGLRLDSDDVEVVRHRARAMAEDRRRNGGRPLEVRFYDAESARVWR